MKALEKLAEKYKARYRKINLLDKQNDKTIAAVQFYMEAEAAIRRLINQCISQ